MPLTTHWLLCAKLRARFCSKSNNSLRRISPMHHGDVASFSRQGQGSLGMNAQVKCLGASRVRSRRFSIFPSSLHDGSIAGPSVSRRRVRFAGARRRPGDSRALNPRSAVQDVVPVLTDGGDGSGNGLPPSQKRVGDNGDGEGASSSAESARVESILAKVCPGNRLMRSTNLIVHQLGCQPNSRCHKGCWPEP